MRYFIDISYKGTNYRGWQRQPNAVSVQEVFEERLFSLLKAEPMLWGCGRTDAMVHASQFIIHFDFDEIPADLTDKLNMILPQDIVVNSITAMHADAHAQFDATERTYDYYFHTNKNAYIADTSSYYNEPNLNIEAMQLACKELINYSDYRAFCKTPDKHNHTICNVFNATLTDKGHGNYLFTITANRFLRGMIRIIMFNLIEVGKGRLSVDQFSKLIEGKTPPKFLKMAYPQGLFLSSIKYPYFNGK